MIISSFIVGFDSGAGYVECRVMACGAYLRESGSPGVRKAKDECSQGKDEEDDL